MSVTNTSVRIERDYMGSMEAPADPLYGTLAQYSAILSNCLGPPQLS